MRLILGSLIGVGCAAALGWSGSVALHRHAEQVIACSAYEAVAGQLAEVASLRTRQPSFVAVDGSTEGLTPRVISAIAAAGLPSSALANLSPDADQPAGAARTPDGKPLYLRRSARIALESLTLPQLGRFLEAWRRAQPGWVVSTIDLSPSSPQGGSSPATAPTSAIVASRDLPLRALLTIEAVIATTAAAPALGSEPTLDLSAPDRATSR